MTPIGLAAWLAGILLVALGYVRAAGAWRRAESLRTQEENIARYESWRGRASTEQTGASEMRALLRRRAQLWGLVAVTGVILIVAGFLVR